MSAAVVVAIIAAIVSLISLAYSHRSAIKVEDYKDKLASERSALDKSEEAELLVARYRDPLLRSAYDLQSRIHNLLGKTPFSGDKYYPDYLRLSTLFVIAQFFGWLEIVRREMQFLDLGEEHKTKELGEKLEAIQRSWSTTSSEKLPLDDYCIYRIQQRAIGELMISRIDPSTRVGPQHQCMDYAVFVKKEDDFALAFDRLGRAIETLPGERPYRLVRVQRGLIDLLDFLDRDKIRFSKHREKLPE